MYTVDSPTDNTTAGDSLCTLREAILAANNDSSYNSNSGCGPASAGDDTIRFDPSISGQTIILGSTLTIMGGQGTLTIDGTGQNITISGNHSVQVMVVGSGAVLILQNLTIAHGKTTFGNGGGISNFGTLTVANSTFSGNSPALYGGGIYNTGTLTITNSTFSQNTAALYGGGIYNSGTLTVTNSAFSGNFVTHDGGGILNYSGGTLTVINSTFSGNDANSGSGISNLGTLEVTNSTFSHNHASSNGGIYNNGGALTVTNSTFSDNSATNGGGIYNWNGGTLIVTNSTFSGNNADNSGGGIRNSSTLTGSPAYYPLNAGSPAIDAGDNGACPATDQRGVTRPQGATCDIGAYEYDNTAPSLVSFTRFNPTTSPTNADVLVFRATFSEAVQNVDAVDFVINATPATTATITGVTQVSASVYEITVSGGDLASYSGIVRIPPIA